MGVLVVLCMVFFARVEATHIAGGDITYVHVGANTYTVTLRVYRDCRGIALGSASQSLQIVTPAGASSVVTMPKISFSDITPTCPGQTAPCNPPDTYNPSGPLGYEEHIYRTNVTINPAVGGGFHTLWWTSCCRNNVITTLTSPGSNSFAIRTLLDAGLNPRNSSPAFLNPPLAIVCAGQPTALSPNATDPDGDFLEYSLTPCQQTLTTNVTYAAGYSATVPLATTAGGATTIDQFNGEINFTASAPQVGVICTRVEEFRNIGGIRTKIGEINRDIQVNVIACNNTNPVIAAIPNQVATVGNQLCVNVSATDVDLDNITLTATSGVGTFTVTSSSAGSATGLFCFTPTLAQQGQTFTVTINAQDDACPSPGSDVETFNITVPAVQCSLAISASAQDASCNQSDGAAAVSQTGGVNPISYNWSNGATTPTITGLAPGTYGVTVIDGFNCVETASVVVGGGSTNITATALSTQPSCPSATDGAITINTTGGVAPITYSLNGGTPQTGNTFTGLGVGSYTITVTDASGCPGITVTATLSAVDNTAPAISCPANLTVSCDASTAPSATGMATATDNCTNATVTYSDATNAGNCAGNYSIIRTWTATDAYGNSSSCTQVITVVDNTPPAVTCSPNINVDNDPGLCSAVVTFMNTAADNCSGATISSSASSGATFPVGTTPVTVSATDGCGNTASCSFTVTVNDVEAPTISCPSNITVNNDAGQCGAVVTYPTPQAADNCQAAPARTLRAGDIAFTGYQSDTPDWFSFVLLTDVASGAMIQFTDNGWFAVGGFRSTEGIIEWTATSDMAAGTVVTITNNVADAGNTAGSIALATSGDQILAYQGTSTSPVFIAAIQMNGGWDVDAINSNTSAIPTGLIDGVNAISIAPEVDNGEYNCSVTSGASAVRAAVNNPGNWNVSNTAITPSGCSFSISSNATIPVLVSGTGSGGTFPVGTTVETYTVSDDSGNTATCSFTVTVEDAEAPEIFCPSNLSVSNDSGVCGAIVPYNVTASDNCAGTSMPTASLSAGDIAFADFNSDDPDSWTFVLLRDISAGTQINFTDNGWFAAGGFRASEGTISWTAGSNLTAGTEITIDGLIASTGSVANVSGSLLLSTSGDQIFAYQGPASAPVFLSGINFDGTGWAADATNANNSALPSTLTNGVNAISVGETDNGAYNCSTTTGGPSVIRAALNNAANWTLSSSRISITNCGFTLPNGSLMPSQSAGLASGATFPVGTTTNTYTVTDAAGNTATCSFDVTVTDNEAPGITCPADLTLECLSAVPAANTASVQATDNCQVDVITHDGDVNNGGSGCPGDPYVVTRTYSVTDIYGNSSSCTQTITVEASPIVVNSLLSPTFACGTNISCNGATDGQINLSTSGGASCAGLTYLWTGPGGFTATSANLTGLGVGTYDVTITDQNGCTATANITLTQPDPLQTAVSATDATCYGFNDGSIDLTVTGGASCQPYSYLWTGTTFDGNGFTASNEDPANLFAGNYSVLVTDANGCTATDNAVIDQFDLVTASFGCCADTFKCTCDTIGLPIDFAGDGPWTVIVSNGLSSDTITTSANPYYYQVSNFTTTTYTLEYVVSTTTGCEGEVCGKATVGVNNCPEPVVAGDDDDDGHHGGGDDDDDGHHGGGDDDDDGHNSGGNCRLGNQAGGMTTGWAARDGDDDDDGHSYGGGDDDDDGHGHNGGGCGNQVDCYSDDCTDLCVNAELVSTTFDTAGCVTYEMVIVCDTLCYGRDGGDDDDDGHHWGGGDDDDDGHRSFSLRGGDDDDDGHGSHDDDDDGHHGNGHSQQIAPFFDISIPCGMVSNVTVPAGVTWSVISNDSITGLTGIRISALPDCSDDDRGHDDDDDGYHHRGGDDDDDGGHGSGGHGGGCGGSSPVTEIPISFTLCPGTNGCGVDICTPLVAFYNDGCVQYEEAVIQGTVTMKTAPAAENSAAEPAPKSWMSAFPNPFATTTTLMVNLTEAAHVDIVVYDMRGVAIRELFAGEVEQAQKLTFDFHGSGLAEGTYIVRMTTSTGEILHRRITLQR